MWSRDFSPGGQDQEGDRQRREPSSSPGSRAARCPASTSTRASSAAPTTKNAITDRMALRLDPVSDTVIAKTAGPKIPANFSKTAKKPKNSDDLWRGIIVAKSERDSAWLPPWT